MIDGPEDADDIPRPVDYANLRKTSSGPPFVTPLARPPIERYVLATVDIPGGQIFAGLAYESGEALEPMRKALADYAGFAAEVMRKKGDALDEDVAHALTEAIRINVEERWPGRPWFVEVWNEREAMTQTYAPYGRPRVR